MEQQQQEYNSIWSKNKETKKFQVLNIEMLGITNLHQLINIFYLFNIRFSKKIWFKWLKQLRTLKKKSITYINFTINNRQELLKKSINTCNGLHIVVGWCWTNIKSLFQTLKSYEVIIIKILDKLYFWPIGALSMLHKIFVVFFFR